MSMETYQSFFDFDGNGVYDADGTETSKGGHAILFFGWGEEADGTKFWWGRNSWGNDSPASKFKFARGKDLCGVESSGAAWIVADPPGKQPSHKLSIESSNPKGFCPDFMLDENLLADRSKISNACVDIKCDGDRKCVLTWGPDCPKDRSHTTVVDIIADANYGSVGAHGHTYMNLKTKTACIYNVHIEDRS